MRARTPGLFCTSTLRMWVLGTVAVMRRAPVCICARRGGPRGSSPLPYFRRAPVCMCARRGAPGGSSPLLYFPSQLLLIPGRSHVTGNLDVVIAGAGGHHGPDHVVRVHDVIKYKCDYLRPYAYSVNIFCFDCDQ